MLLELMSISLALADLVFERTYLDTQSSAPSDLTQPAESIAPDLRVQPCQVEDLADMTIALSGQCTEPFSAVQSETQVFVASSLKMVLGVSMPAYFSFPTFVFSVQAARMHLWILLGYILVSTLMLLDMMSLCPFLEKFCVEA